MKTIGVRELKAHLSRVLKEVGSGDMYLVTDRGRVVAELRQPREERAALSPELQPLARLVADRQLRIAKRRANYPMSPLTSPAGVAKRLVDEDRGD
jgi:prevent-host-death family protein